jgi:vanillate O-demethylase ferredoxin subunit
MEARDICSLELVSADDKALPAFSAGAHIDVHLPGGLVRQYSLCNSPAETHRYLIAVLRAPVSRGGSTEVHDTLSVGHLLTISLPRNLFPLAPEARKSLLLAGGIGVTPMLCMAEQLAASGADFTLHYAARSRDHMAFIQRIGAGPVTDRVQLHFDDGAAPQRLDLQAVLAAPEPGKHLYVCGPKGFIDAVLTTARAKGWDGAALHWEFFGGAGTQPGAGDCAFEVQIASSGQLIVVSPRQTVTQALAAAGVNVPVSCEQGICGTCVTRVLEGEPDHRDNYLMPDEQAANDVFTPCCSRAKTARLVIDL